MIKRFICYVFVFLSLSGCFFEENFLNDKNLIDLYENNIGEFSSLIKVLKSKKNILRIAEDFMNVEDIGNIYKVEQNYLSLSLWNDLLKKFEHLKVAYGVSMRHKPHFKVKFIVNSMGNVGGGKSKGILYSENPIKNHVESLDSFNVSPKSGRAYKKINRNWYLFFEWGG